MRWRRPQVPTEPVADPVTGVALFSHLVRTPSGRPALGLDCVLDHPVLLVVELPESPWLVLTLVTLLARARLAEAELPVVVARGRVDLCCEASHFRLPLCSEMGSDGSSRP